MTGLFNDLLDEHRKIHSPAGISLSEAKHRYQVLIVEQMRKLMRLRENRIELEKAEETFEYVQ